MSKTIFEHINNIAAYKTSADSYTESDWKSYSPYMINKWLSMKSDLLALVGYIDKYYTLPKKVHYKLLQDILPAKKLFIKYVKTKKQPKYEPELIKFLSSRYELSKDEIKSYLELLFCDKSTILRFKEELESYGFDSKTIKKYLRVK